MTKKKQKFFSPTYNKYGTILNWIRNNFAIDMENSTEGFSLKIQEENEFTENPLDVLYITFKGECPPNSGLVTAILLCEIRLPNRILIKNN